MASLFDYLEWRGDLTFEEGLKKESRRCRMLFQEGCRGALCLGPP